METLHRKVESQEPKPTDEDIANAASDYVGYNEDKDTVPIRYLSREQCAIKAYKQGAKDMRDNKIYISPKDNTTHPLIPSPQHQVNEAIKYFNKIIQPKEMTEESSPLTVKKVIQLIRTFDIQKGKDISTKEFDAWIVENINPQQERAIKVTDEENKKINEFMIRVGQKERREDLIRFAKQFYADEETAIHNVDKFLNS